MQKENLIIKTLFDKHQIKYANACLLCSTIGDGWTNLLDKTLFLAKSINKNIKICQIKEKFGALTIYSESPTDCNVEEIFQAAKRASVRICYFCGEKGTLLAPQGWIVCLCPTCFAQKYKNESKSTVDFSASLPREII